MRSFKAASSTLSPSWMSRARLAFPSRLELNRPEGSFNAAPLGNVILTTFLYVSPVQTMPPWDQMGVPIHFHSSTISGSASCTMSRTFASVFPRQSPSSLILPSINAEADSTGTDLFMYGSISGVYFSCATTGTRALLRFSASWRWAANRALNAELLCVLGVQSLPAAEFHGLGAGEASNRLTREKPLEDVEADVPARCAPRDEA